jgi:two-component system sensor histidine kinase BaeS
VAGARGLFGPLARRAAALSLAVSLASIAIVSTVTVVLLDLDLVHTGQEQDRVPTTSAIVAAVATAYEAGDGWSDAEWGPAVTLARLEGAGLTVKSAGKVVLRVAPAAKGGLVEELPVRANGKVVAQVVLSRPRSGLSPTEINLRHSLVDGILVSSAGAAVLAVFFALFASRRLAAPLWRLTLAVKRYGAGDRSSRAGPVRGSAEIVELGQAFDTMAGELDKEDQLGRALVADVAHELRTPLAILRAQLDAISMGLAEPSDSTVTSLAQEVDRMTDFVDDLGVLAAAQSAGLRLDLAPVDLARSLDAASRRLAARFDERRVSVHTSARPCIVLGDARRLEQVVVNLLTNAEKFSPEGSTVRVACSPEDGMCTLSVSDDGPGIPVEDQPLVFDRFYRGSNVNQLRRTTGSGVGLAVVAEIVAAHGGYVELQSAPGHGSTFTVRLPAADWPAPG